MFFSALPCFFILSGVSLAASSPASNAQQHASVNNDNNGSVFQL
jgi:hypothetical protein